MIRIILIAFFGILGIQSATTYIKTLSKLDQKTPIMERYQKSYLSRTVSAEKFKRLQANYPTTADFLVGLDPRASKVYPLRWFVLILIGWIHFTYFSRFSSRVTQSGVTRTQLFLTPVGLALAVSLLQGIQFLIGLYDAGIAKIFGNAIITLAGVVFAVFALVSILSIPVSAGIFAYQCLRTTVRCVRTAFCSTWNLGVRVFGQPQRTLAVKIHNFVITRNQSKKLVDPEKPEEEKKERISETKGRTGIPLPANGKIGFI